MRLLDVAPALALAAIVLVASVLRFTGLNWDEGLWIHPDEGHMRTILSVIEVPRDPSLYFDTARSPLNSVNRGYQYSYGTLPMFLTRLVAEWLDSGCQAMGNGLGARLAWLLVGGEQGCLGGAFTGSRGALVGRGLSALADVGTVLLVFVLGRRLYGQTVGLLAALLAALSAFSVQQAHFFTVDSMAAFFTLLTATFAVRAGQLGAEDRAGAGASSARLWVNFAPAGVATGLAAACKVSAGMVALLVILAGLWWLIGRAPLTQRLVRQVALAMLLAGVLAFVAFRVAQPYAFDGPGFFGVHPNANWFGRLAQINAEQGGELDYPSGRQWTNRTPIVFPWVNIVVWGMGLPLGVAATVAWVWMGVELFRGQRRHLVLWVWTTVVFLYLGTRWVMTMRYFLPLYPLLTLFVAYGLVRLIHAPSRPWWVAGGALAAVVGVGALLWTLAVFSIYLRPHPRIAGSRWMYDNVPQGATIANEHWDWGLPLRVDGKDPFSSMYRGLELALYDEDDEEKRQKLYAWLDEADVIVMASNRLYASISRLPTRYPLTTTYYRALFAGELGFELAADFTSYPALGPFVFPDQEQPFPLIAAAHTEQSAPVAVDLPPAEEAFSVYDHPRVLIFRKTADYSRARVEQVLGAVDLSRAERGLTPRESSSAASLLQFDAKTWQEQQAGGTWSAMFDRRSLTNRYPGLAALVWWLASTVMGGLVFPLLFAALPRLRDRGYGVARVLALVLLAYLTWLAASLRLLPNTRATIAAAFVLMTLVGARVGWRHREALRAYIRRNWRLLLWMEAAFAALYWFWVGVRLLNPDLWHPIVGGEKPMDFAYFNAVMKSTWFPPYNPWLSGATINYYYFGFVIVGSLTKLLGTVPALAYNLAVPLLAAMTGLGAFSVGYNLFGSHRRGALLTGILALVFTVLVGNLGVVRLLRESLVRLGGPEPFPSTIPGFASAVAMLRGLWQVVAHGAKLPLRIETWYWYPTRIIPAAAGEAGPITEFPAFTFLYADLHAHMIALPLTLFALALAVYWARETRPRWGSIALGGLIIGALWPTNTWDYPTYLGLGLMGLFLGGCTIWRNRARVHVGAHIWRQALVAGALIVLSLVLYLPYTLQYAAGYSSVLPWTGSRTPTNVYLWIHGVFLFATGTRMVVELWRQYVRGRQPSMQLRLLAGLLLLAAVSGLLSANGYPVATVAVPLLGMAVFLLLAPGIPASRRLLWLFVALATLLTLVVEAVVLKGDINRMNTVFKFYLQVWVLFAIAAALSIAWMREWARRWLASWQRAWWIVVGVLVAGSALFLPFGIRSRALDRMAAGTGLTLDGMAYMDGAMVVDGDPAGEQVEIPLAGDAAAIRWMQDHIEGSPVIIEGLGHREYLWANRVSIYTGLPTVVGWRWHQVQQRVAAADAEVDRRREDVMVFYHTPSVGQAMDVLQRYGVRYVYVGPYERAYYNAVGMDKFEAMADQGLLRLVYDAQGVSIYQVIGE
ncbi:MAG: phospholipid carrier-dependent glycosyltransferase [Anaerolineales bacterium]|nr:phospholipid carrier-dependent glycosyltransferase [Anaerolineales bacterium]